MGIDFEQKLIQQIMNKTVKGNIDNISRTTFYESFYFHYKEIKWALLAGVVSRNAGWNMCDLESDFFASILPKQSRNNLFLTYERANWLIFQDAYPQLLLYHYSKKFGYPLFHLLPYFSVSKFMMKEWMRFWKTGDERRLLYSLIINEQNLIQAPIILKPFYQKKVFRTLPFYFQELLHYSIVIFPTSKGELYGASVKKFKKVDCRIELGKVLAWILFESGNLPYFLNFIKKTPATGSRYDYEKLWLKRRNTPFLRLTYPIMEHKRSVEKSWDEVRKVKKSWYNEPRVNNHVHLTNWYKKKRKEIEMYANIKDWLKMNE